MNDLLHALQSHPVFSGGLALAVGGAVVAWLRRLPGLGIGWVRRRLIYTVETHDKEVVFGRVKRWLAEQPSMANARDLSIGIRREDRDGVRLLPGSGPVPPHVSDSSPSPAPKEMLALLPSPGMHVFRFRGRHVVAHHSRREIQTQYGAMFSESIVFRFFGVGRAFVEAFVRDIDEYTAEKDRGTLINILSARMDNWVHVATQPRRPAQSLTLADGLFEDIISDLESFCRSESWYAERGIPYRRGYLLHGPPGTGKTTLAAVLAGELKYSVASLSLGDSFLTDAVLRALFDNLPASTILVIEDIDCVFREREATSDRIGVTLSGLLNVLDGIGSKEGRILFMTTNHPERLDPALIRPGRIDRRIELGYATPDQARRMFAWFFKGHAIGEEMLTLLASGFASRTGPNVAPAAIQEHLLRHRDDPEEALAAWEDARPLVIPVKVDARFNGHAARATMT